MSEPLLFSSYITLIARLTSDLLAPDSEEKDGLMLSDALSYAKRGSPQHETQSYTLVKLASSNNIFDLLPCVSWAITTTLHSFVY